MRLGLLARADDRGLGLMSWAVQRHLNPEATLVVDAQQGFAVHRERFPNAPVVKSRAPQFRAMAEELLGKIDVLLTLETPYNWDLYNWARSRGVATVLVAMPEYHRPYLGLPQPDLIVSSTDYMYHLFPSARVLPWPVDLVEIAYRPRTHAGTWLHVAGQPCAHDRQGTKLAMETFARLPHRDLLVRAQVRLHGVKRLPNMTVVAKATATVGALYEQGDVLVMPRRYAGQSLVMNEAQAAGLGIVCLDRAPENGWGTATVKAHEARTDPRFGFTVWDADPADVAEVVERVSEDDALCARLSAASRERAESISWDVLREPWLELLDQASRKHRVSVP